MGMRSLVVYPPQAGEPQLSREEHEALTNLALTSACRRGMENASPMRQRRPSSASAPRRRRGRSGARAPRSVVGRRHPEAARGRQGGASRDAARRALRFVLAIPRASQCSDQAKRLTTERGVRGRRRNLASSIARLSPADRSAEERPRSPVHRNAVEPSRRACLRQRRATVRTDAGVSLVSILIGTSGDVLARSGDTSGGHVCGCAAQSQRGPRRAGCGRCDHRVKSGVRCAGNEDGDGFGKVDPAAVAVASPDIRLPPGSAMSAIMRRTEVADGRERPRSGSVIGTTRDRPLFGATPYRSSPIAARPPLDIFNRRRDDDAHHVEERHRMSRTRGAYREARNPRPRRSRGEPRSHAVPVARRGLWRWRALRPRPS
jgi:hypothetical protein